MAKPVIKVENLSKQYRLGGYGSGTLTDDLKRWWANARGKEDPFIIIGESNDRSVASESQYVWSLRDINFEVQQGEVVGLIGKNGAGKSTLLKVLSKVTGPTLGKAYLKGRVGSMLEVGTGFHPELTGRENIFLNGTILGMRKKEVAKKLDDIVEFAGVARYLETPVKRYSSGMTVRLAFAVAAHLEPEILLVDEVLAVGDAEFQKKCLGKMGEVSKEGRTILFVSHNLGSMRRLCNRGVLLQNGEMAYVGNIDTALEKYLNSGGTDDDGDASNSVSFDLNDSMVQLTEIAVENSQGEGKSTYYYGEKIYVNIKYVARQDTRNIGIRIAVSRNGETLFLSQDTDIEEELLGKKAAGEYAVRVAMPGFLKSGLYTISVYLMEVGVPKEEKIDILKFVLDDSNTDTTNKSFASDKPGILRPHLTWEYVEFPVPV
ncbi:MAG: ABC transporter ATP-binding protein [Lewinellaceae bacterium]|nr:ABC transporter ATP-binding protein [Saprospiraceae bacterium]MCB9338333.1 ABC transporter ATP-binding protein [Lewinellaceae bacterium]